LNAYRPVAHGYAATAGCILRFSSASADLLIGLIS
jgi:hypothetical protein